MAAGCGPWPAFEVCGGAVSHVACFKCLGSMIGSSVRDLGEEHLPGLLSGGWDGFGEVRLCRSAFEWGC